MAICKMISLASLQNMDEEERKKMMSLFISNSLPVHKGYTFQIRWKKYDHAFFFQRDKPNIS